MKKKTTWKTAAGLALATATWLSIAKDEPITAPPPPVLPGRFTECPEGFYRKLIEGQWRCWPRYVPPPPPPGPPPPPVLPGRFTECPEGQERKLIGGQWRCWSKEKPGGR